MTRGRRALGREQRLCATCRDTRWFEVYESWERPTSRWVRTKNDRRVTARCEQCLCRTFTPQAS